MRMPIWMDNGGLIRLYLDDCSNVLPDIDPVDAIITDPPYGIGYDIASERAVSDANGRVSHGQVSGWDDARPEKKYSI